MIAENSSDGFYLDYYEHVEFLEGRSKITEFWKLIKNKYYP